MNCPNLGHPNLGGSTTMHNEDEIENNFHDDRRRNLQSFFKDNSDHPAMVGRFHDSDSEESDRIIPQNSMFGTRENFHDDHEEDKEQDSTGFESSYDSENSMKDPFEFPSHYGFAKTENSNNEVKHSPAEISGFSDSHWDNFFTGHADTIEKDIHSLSKQSDDHTAPPDDYNDEQAEENDEEEGNLLKGIIDKKTNCF